VEVSFKDSVISNIQKTIVVDMLVKNAVVMVYQDLLEISRRRIYDN